MGKRKVYYISWLGLCILLLLPLVVKARNGEQILRDPSFSHGFAISPDHPAKVGKKGGWSKACTDTLRFFESVSVAPEWQLCQWYGRYGLEQAQETRKRRKVGYATEDKTVTLERNGTLTLEVKSDADYVHPRRDGENWPHLLIQQLYEKQISLSDMTGLRLSFDLRLVYCESMMGNRYNPGLHGAQAPIYLYLTNTNDKSKDYKKKLWLGLVGFDSRDEVMTDTFLVFWDKGSSTYICHLPRARLWGTKLLQDCKWHNVDFDILPLLSEAILRMRNEGLFQDTEVSDFSISSMNFGWEMPGTFRAAIQLRNLSLWAEH